MQNVYVRHQNGARHTHTHAAAVCFIIAGADASVVAVVVASAVVALDFIRFCQVSRENIAVEIGNI